MQPGGGRRVSERLPQGYFDMLSAKIWRVGNLALGSVLENVMPPSILRGSPIIVNNRLALELTFDFRYNVATEAAEPVEYTAILSEIEPCQGRQEADIWYWRQFTLDVRRRRKEFSRGVTIVIPELGEIDLTQGPPIHGPRRRTSAIWQDIQQSELTCTSDDYEWFMENLTVVQRDLQEQ